jgi:hypothetical protein
MMSAPFCKKENSPETVSRMTMPMYSDSDVKRKISRKS